METEAKRMAVGRQICEKESVLLKSTRKTAQQGDAPNTYPRHAPCLVATLPARIAPRVGIGDLGRSLKK